MDKTILIDAWLTDCSISAFDLVDLLNLLNVHWLLVIYFVLTRWIFHNELIDYK